MLMRPNLQVEDGAVGSWSDVRIVDVKTTILAVPYKQSLLSSRGRRLEAKTTTLIEVETDGGITGLGEVPNDIQPQLMSGILAWFKDIFVGEDPTQINLLRHRCKTATYWHRYLPLANHAIAGIELALADITGKILGVPLHQVLGGAIRSHVNHHSYLFRGPIDRMVQDARAAVEAGFTVLYTKVGHGPREDSAMLQAIRDEVGDDIVLRVDANGAWTLREALENLRAFQRFGLDWIEQPVAEIDDMVELRKAVDVPICIDQGAASELLSYRAVEQGAVDVICTDPCRVGGMVPMQQIAAYAAERGVKICSHLSTGYGIASQAIVHLLATIPNLTSGNQTYRLHLESDIVNEPTDNFVKGDLEVLNAPGIGVTLNTDLVEKYAHEYRHGPARRWA
jgi:L-alanine-DL-glutamate epimerase-like enolase superfamily enzyme